MPIHEDNDPNYAQVVSATSNAPPISPGQPKQNGEQIMNALDKATNKGATGAGSTGKQLPTAKNYSSVAPDSPGGADADMYAGATDSVLGADAGLDAAGAAEGTEGAEGLGALEELLA